MREKSIPPFLLTGTLALIGSIVGFISGGLLYYILPPSWTITSIGEAIDGATDILFVDYKYLEAMHLEENALFIQFQFGEVYAVTQDRWQLLPPLPNRQTISQIWRRDWDTDAPIIAVATQGNVYQMVDEQWEAIENPTDEFKGVTPRACAAQWKLPAAEVTDSAGTVFSHALGDEYVCYVLFKDGRLQVWLYTRNAFSLMGNSTLGAVIGLIAGLTAIPMWHRFRNMGVKHQHL